MSIQAVDIDATSDFICKGDKDSKEPTIFKIGHINSLVLSDIETTDVIYNESESQTKFKANIFGREMDYVRYGLKGWDNFLDVDGKAVKFVTESSKSGGRYGLIVSDSTLRRIPPYVIKEIAEAIRSFNKLTESERKN